MKIFAYIALSFVALSAYAGAQAIDTCGVYGYVFDVTGMPDTNVFFSIIRIEKTGATMSSKLYLVKSDSNGYIHFTVPRNSTAYIYAKVSGFDGGIPQTGTPFAIPDSATAELRYLEPVTATTTLGTLNNRVTTVESQTDSLLDGVVWQGNQWALTTSGGVAVAMTVGGNDTVRHGMIVVADSLSSSTDSSKVRRALTGSVSAVGVVWNPANVAGALNDTSVYVIVSGRTDILVDYADSVFALRSGAEVIASDATAGYGAVTYDATKPEQHVGAIVGRYAIKESKVYVEAVVQTR